MLSFFGQVLLKAILLHTSKNKNVNTMSLQVLCNLRLNTSKITHLGKRVLPFTSVCSECTELQASMALEAAMVFPVFIFFMIALLTPMRALDTQRKLQTELERSCEEMSLYLYGQEKRNDDSSAWMDEQGNIEKRMMYVEKIPFFLEGMPGISIEIASRRRAWIGTYGKVTVSGTANNGSGGVDSEEMVYVGKSMGRFHRNRTCHYLSNDYQTIPRKQAEQMRNADGHVLTACSSCKKNNAPNEMVYITPGGRHYHNRMDCQSMISYVRRVPISEVRHLGACSYCGGE